MSEMFSSPFSHVLHTNYVASSTETQAIHDLLASPTQELSRLAGEISLLQKALETLTARSEGLKSHVDAHLALISPFRRLPAEIISEIFIRCLPTDRNPTRSMTEAPLLLTVISKSLREIALSTPQLWNALHVFLPNSSFSNSVGMEELEPLIERRREGLEAWFKRSRCLPLSISVYLSGYGRLAGSVSDSYVDFLKSIISFSNRWKRIQLHLSPFFVDMLNALVADLSPEDIPMLESLDVFYDSNTDNRRQGAAAVYLPPSGSRKPQLPLHGLISNAPSLHSFAVHHHSHSMDHLQLPWKNLTSLTMKSDRDSSRLTVDQTLHLLANSPNLSTCTLGVLLTSSAPGLDIPDISLSSLGALSLYFTLPSGDLPFPEVENQLFSIFSVIRAPILSRFAFITQGFDLGRAFGSIPFAPLLESSTCDIEELYLSFPLKSQDILVECLRTLPSITHLYLESCMPSHNRFLLNDKSSVAQILDDAFMGHLSIGEGNLAPLCPRLEKLVLPDCKYVSEEALLAFAHSRAHSRDDPEVSRLKLLDVHFTCDRSESLANSERPDRDAADSRLTGQLGILRGKGIFVSWNYPVRDVPHIPDSPWEGLTESAYPGWRPELLSSPIH
ncbi:hypothetical protein D9757_011104 [Collybiopsis confluens]|uniref:F-box domain-containing protein n=1 Tax=Collybiopsis confluens TaxID=2823264 RepID=A0A8H5GX89_9AGAR|nr:hypothetical protein D9757_011104 [Collybiopsis confluens]